MIMPQPIATLDPAHVSPERELMRRMYRDGSVFMMGQNPDLPVMPEKPKQKQNLNGGWIYLAMIIMWSFNATEWRSRIG